MFNQISMKKSIFFLINITMIFIIDSLAIFPNIDHIVSNFCLVIYNKHGEIKKRGLIFSNKNIQYSLGNYVNFHSIIKAKPELFLNNNIDTKNSNFFLIENSIRGNINRNRTENSFHNILEKNPLLKIYVNSGETRVFFFFNTTFMKKKKTRAFFLRIFKKRFSWLIHSRSIKKVKEKNYIYSLKKNSFLISHRPDLIWEKKKHKI